MAPHNSEPVELLELTNSFMGIAYEYENYIAKQKDARNAWGNRNGRLLFTQSYEGYKFPEEKPRALGLIEEGIEVQE